MLLDATFATPVIAHRRSILADSILASSLDRRALERLEALGEVVSVPSGTAVFEEGAPSDHLYVVLDGALLPSTTSGPPSFWVGPGDLCGEGGFATGAPRGTTMVAFGPDPRLWRIHRDVLSRLDGASNAAVDPAARRPRADDRGAPGGAPGRRRRLDRGRLLRPAPPRGDGPGPAARPGRPARDGVRRLGGALEGCPTASAPGSGPPPRPSPAATACAPPRRSSRWR